MICIAILNNTLEPTRDSDGCGGECLPLTSTYKSYILIIVTLDFFM